MNALESVIQHAQCYDIAVLDDGTIAVLSKDYKIYLYHYKSFITKKAETETSLLRNLVKIIKEKMTFIHLFVSGHVV